MTDDNKLIVKFEFVANPESPELSINVGEIITLINTDIGDGWWEGVNERGERGLFPKEFTSFLDGRSVTEFEQGFKNQQAQQFPPPPPPPPQTLPAPVQIEQTAQHAHASVEEPDWPDDEWDDDDDSCDNGTEYEGSRGINNVGSYNTPPNAYSFPSQYNPSQFHLQQQQHHQQQNEQLSSAISSMTLQDKFVPKPKKNLIRFSNSVKTGLEKFILDPRTIDVAPESRVYIQNDEVLGVVWKASHSVYTCAISKHGRESKMKGLKSYISYDITPSTNNIGVRRRYKHFDWLMQRLEEKYLFSPLPPLPEKQISGRFSEDFVEHRRNLLQLYVNYITRHPILSQCDVWWHFITCSSDDLKGWKFGKRKAEKDELVGGNFFHSVEIHPDVPQLDNVKTSKQLDNFQRFVAKFDEAAKIMYCASVDLSKKYATSYSKDYKRLSEALQSLSSAFQSGTAWRNSLALNEAMWFTSSVYGEISKLYEDEPKYDFEPMADILHQYRGLLSGWPEVLQLHKHAVNVKNDQEKLAEEGKGDIALARINQKTNLTTYVALAEINHFHNERLVDFKQMMQIFLTAQINFHTDILSKLQTALNKVNDA